MRSVLFICTGNTCRSPMAAGLFAEYAAKKGLASLVSVKSAGLAASPGAPACENAVLAAAQLGADISSHRSRPLSAADLSGDTRFVCMTAQHAQALQSAGVPASRVLALSVSDPFLGDAAVYRRCAQQLSDEMPRVFRFVFGCDDIRPMTSADAPAAAALERACFSHPWSEASLRASLEQDGARFFLLSADGRPAGYIGASLVAGEGYMNNLAVLPDFRRRGFARMLLTALCDCLQKEDAAFLTLEVRKSNAPAVSLYQSAGFQTVGERRRFYRDPEEDALLMTLLFLHGKELLNR